MDSNGKAALLGVLACGIVLARCGSSTPQAPTVVVTVPPTPSPIVETYNFNMLISRSGWNMEVANITVQSAGPFDVRVTELRPNGPMYFFLGLRNNAVPPGIVSTEGDGGPQATGFGPDLYGHWDEIKPGQYRLTLSPYMLNIPIPPEGYATTARVVVTHS